MAGNAALDSPIGPTRERIPRAVATAALVGLGLLLAACAAGPPVLRVKNEVLHAIDPRLFGHFLERPSWEGENGVEGALEPGTHAVQHEVLAIMRDMHIPVLRFPGGTDVDYLDWRDMVDNVPGRRGRRPVSTGHRGDRITNRFGYDEFLRLCEDLGAEPILVVNFRDALLRKKPLARAARDAASLVAYVNAPLGASLPAGLADWPSVRARNGRTEPYRVRYFQIGNETWFFLKELKRFAPGSLEASYVDYLEAYVTAMRAVDPTIEIIVDGLDSRMDRIVKRIRERLGNRVSFFAMHLYGPGAYDHAEKGGKWIAFDTMSDEAIWNAWVAVPRMDAHGRSVLDHPGLRLARERGSKVAMTEWNWNGWPEDRRDRDRPVLASELARGIGAAGLLHAMMRAGDVVRIGCQSMLVGNRWSVTSIRADRNARSRPYTLPTGEITAFYAKHHGAHQLRLEQDRVPTFAQPYRIGGISAKQTVAYVDALATADRDTVYVHAINRHFARSIAVRIDLSDLDLGPGAKVAAHHAYEGRLTNDPRPGEPRSVGRLRQEEIRFTGSSLDVVLPRRSVSCITIEAAVRTQGRADR